MDSLIDERKKQLQAGGQNGVDNSDANDVNDDYYENLKNESYKAMLSKEVQAAVAQDQALKYTNNALMANGYGTQGLSESAMTGIGNKYQAALRDAQNDYSNSILNINQQQRQEALNTANSDFQSASALLSGASSQEMLDKIYNSYKGTMDPASEKQFNLMYEMYKEGLANPQIGSNVDISNFSGYAYDSEGNLVNNQGNQFNKELEDLTSQQIIGQLSSGDYVKVSNTTGYDTYLYYNNGQFYYVTKEQYDKQNKDKKWHISGKDRGTISKG